MIDLDREIATWAAAVNAERCGQASGIAELTDHLSCEIERARAQGLSDEEAFRTATARVGSASELTAEYAKNRTALGEACQVAAKLDRPLPNPAHRRLLLIHAGVWAAITIASAFVLKKTSPPEVASWTLIGILIPLWLASDLVLRSVLRHSQAKSR